MARDHFLDELEKAAKPLQSRGLNWLGPQPEDIPPDDE